MRKLFFILMLSSILFAYDDYEYDYSSFNNNEEVEKHNEHHHWDYSASSGPAEWGYLKEEYRMCKDGKNQSPIDITNAYETQLDHIKLFYRGETRNIINNGHTIQANVDNGSYLELDGKQYRLIQFHFHTPSENHINGRSFPMEAHFVHKSDSGELLVLAVMFIEGKNNRAFDDLIKGLPVQKKVSYAHINFLKFLPTDLDYYRFNGSLTTPPCSEGVVWLVLKKPIEVSSEQIEALHKLLHTNNRPVQALNARIIVK